MPKPQRRRKGTWAIAWGLAALGLATLGYLKWVPEPSLSRPQLVDIETHANRWVIAKQLTAAGILRDPFDLALWALLHPGMKLRAGTYQFQGDEPTAALFNQMSAGRVFTLTLVVPEGYNRFDVARSLEALGIGSAADFLAATAKPALVRDLDPYAVSLEGYLYPDTYFISPHAGPGQVAAMMVNRFRQAWQTSHWLANEPHISAFGSAHATSARQFHDWLTLASLVEKETSVPRERVLIAGVFVNRLSRGLPLQCDPTVIYAALLNGVYQGTIGRLELNLPSPYNTYLEHGLPPGAIANPGAASLQAAAQPEVTPYLYFVSDGHGGHRFAATLAEHERNVELYRRGIH